MQNQGSTLPIIDYARNTVAIQSAAPRTVDGWRILRAVVSWRLLVILIVQVILSIIVEYVHQTQVKAGIVDVRYYLFYIMAFPLWAIVLHQELISPLYRWWRALRVGKLTVAYVIAATQRMIHYRMAVEGHWQCTIGHRTYDLPFRIYLDDVGAWASLIKVGSAVSVLLHPTKTQVLVPLSLAEPYSLSNSDSTASQLLATLLIEATHSVRSSPSSRHNRRGFD